MDHSHVRFVYADDDDNTEDDDDDDDDDDDEILHVVGIHGNDEDENYNAVHEESDLFY